MQQKKFIHYLFIFTERLKDNEKNMQGGFIFQVFDLLKNLNKFWYVALQLNTKLKKKVKWLMQDLFENIIKYIYLLVLKLMLQLCPFVKMKLQAVLGLSLLSFRILVQEERIPFVNL